MIDTQQRVYARELIDGDDFDQEEYQTMLRQLDLINQLSRGYSPTLKALAGIVAKNPGRKLRILDIGFGHGDTLRAIRTWADRRDLDLELTGVDLNPRAAEIARKATPSEMRIEYKTSDVFDLATGGDSDKRYDVMINALFMHHLDDDQIVRLLAWMTEQAGLAWFINDLHRHPIAYHFIKHATRLAGFNRLIRNDAPLSVARSFSSDDWRMYAQQARVPQHSLQVRWHFPFRYGVLCDTVKARTLK